MEQQAMVFILMGQSNAVGHGLPMAEEDRICKPQKNVFGLSRQDNLSYHIRSLRWQGYVSGGMNLGEEQDHTWSVANCLAKQWQAAIDGGRQLPDLYIVQIAIGAQGVTAEYMWYPDRPRRLIPGPLGTADISLHPLATHILSLLPESFQAMGKKPRYLIHWRGGENDMTVPARQLQKTLLPIYRRMFADYWHALGGDGELVLHRLICRERAMERDPSGGHLASMAQINAVFDTLAEEKQTSVLDVRSCPYYVADTRQHGIFLEDAVHFTPEVNNWVARQILAGLA